MEGRLELEEPADGSAGRKVQVGVQANPNSFKPRPYRCVKFFGMNRKSLILSSQEKFLSLVIVARTVNRHRWVGRAYQGDRENYGAWKNSLQGTLQNSTVSSV